MTGRTTRQGAGRTSTPAGAWARLLARWELLPGSASERALATAVLLDASRHAPALRRAAWRVLGGLDAGARPVGGMGRGARRGPVPRRASPWRARQPG